MWVATASGPRPDDGRGAVQLLAVGEPRTDFVDQFGVEGAVLAGRRGQVPPVDQMIGAELPDVLGGVFVAVRQVHGVHGRRAARRSRLLASVAAS